MTYFTTNILYTFLSFWKILKISLENSSFISEKGCQKLTLYFDKEGIEPRFLYLMGSDIFLFSHLFVY